MLVPLFDDRLPVRLHLFRDDLLHPELPGNKWRKLKHNLTAARAQGHHTLATFGGAYSNHIKATAAAGRLYGFDTLGFIRGEEHLPLNPVLEHAVAQGMRLSYLDRAAYRAKTAPPGDYYLLPEGGSNSLAVLGCAELGSLFHGFDVVAVPVGTGGTLAGLAAGLPTGRALGFAVLKGGGFLTDEVARLQRETYGSLRGDWSIETRFHFGGYHRHTPALTDFLADFESRHRIGLDPTYTGKMMAGLHTLIAEGVIAAGSRVCAVITGPVIDR